jgi:integrase
MGRTGRPKGRTARRPNHHLKVVGAVWHVRIIREGLGDLRFSTGTGDVEEARAIRDRALAECEAKRQELTRRAALGLPEVSTVKGLVALYLEAESGTYDRETGGEQPGRKRTADSDRVLEKRMFRFLDGSVRADGLDGERLLDLARGMEGAKLAPLSRRHVMRFLSRVYTWAQANPRKTGIVANPLAQLDRRSAEWKRLFPRGVAKQAPPFSREELRKLYGLLPSYAMRPARFAAHTGMRCPSELLRMVWGRADFEKRAYRTDPRWTKGGREREVPLGDVALGLLQEIRPEGPEPLDAVWLGPERLPLRNFRGSFEEAVKDVCAEPGPGWRRPTIHSLRDTCATALEKVASKAIVKKVLGHSAADVTDLYVQPSLEDCLAALNRAALLIDGEATENVVPLWREPKTAEKTADRSVS